MSTKKEKTCPACNSKVQKVIYFGFPMYLCTSQTCMTLWGFWSFIPCIWFNGMFMVYKGSYLKALYHWLKGDINE